MTLSSVPGAGDVAARSTSACGVTSFGRHQLHHEPPDLHVVRLDGSLEIEEGLAMLAANAEYVARARYILLLVDLRTAWVAPVETRKLVATIDRRCSPWFLGCIGGSFSSRVMMNVGVRAANFFCPGGMTAAFFEEEAPARAWLYAQRRRMTETS
ncbi:hypothetical protein [Chondromyces crocatus]|nr:hypothetical protein [Chondromyces crocatus]